ncbi:MAG: hypothetical protein AB7H96_12950 [Vicinamibacterales bacterium]
MTGLARAAAAWAATAGAVVPWENLRAAMIEGSDRIGIEIVEVK